MTKKWGFKNLPDLFEWNNFKDINTNNYQLKGSNRFIKNLMRKLIEINNEQNIFSNYIKILNYREDR